MNKNVELVESTIQNLKDSKARITHARVGEDVVE